MSGGRVSSAALVEEEVGQPVTSDGAFGVIAGADDMRGVMAEADGMLRGGVKLKPRER